MSEEYTDYHDLHRRGPHATYVKEYRVGGSTPVRMLKIMQPPGHLPDPPTPDLVIQMPIRATTVACADVGAGRWRGRAEPGQVWIAPPDAHADYLFDETNGFLAVAMPFSKVRQALAEASPEFTGDFGWLHAAPFRDPSVEFLCGRLWDEAVDGNPYGSLFADGAMLALVAALLRRSTGTLPVNKTVRKGGLSPARLRRVLDFMYARLGENLDLQALAAAVDLSPFHFSRAFKAETGLTPRRFLTERRLQHAQELLQHTELSVTDVALDCGFADPQYLAKLFRRTVGTTPSEYRRSARM